MHKRGVVWPRGAVACIAAYVSRTMVMPEKFLRVMPVLKEIPEMPRYA